jgi:hypothetical protein
MSNDNLKSLDALIARLENEADQIEGEWEEVVSAIERIPPEDLTPAQRQELEKRFRAYLKRMGELGRKSFFALETHSRRGSRGKD